MSNVGYEVKFTLVLPSRACNARNTVQALLALVRREGLSGNSAAVHSPHYSLAANFCRHNNTEERLKMHFNARV